MRSILAKDQKSKQELTPEQRQDLKFAEDYYDVAIQIRRPYERQWYLNMAFFLGKQWVTWNNAKWQLEYPLSPSWRVRLVSNHIMPIILHIVAKLSQNRPVYKVIPASGESEALNDAIVSERVLKYLHQLHNQFALNQDLFMTMSIYGSAFKYPYYDAYSGKHFRKVKTQSNEGGEEVPVMGVNGEPEFWDVYEGEVKEEILDPFSILPEPGAKSMEDSNRIMKLTLRPLEYIRQRYSAGKYVQAESKSEVSSIESQLRGLMDEQYQQKSVAFASVQEAKKGISHEGFATVKELRERPSKEFPRGRQIIICNGVLLHSGDLPYKYLVERNSLGIVKYDYIKVPGRFWGKSIVEDLIPIQMELNKTRSQIIEIKNLMSKPKWVAFKESHIPSTSITSEPGEVIQPRFVPGVPEPHPITPPPIPAYVENEISINERDLEEIGLIHEVSKGTTPPGIRSGVAIQFLQEQDQTVFAPVISRFEAQESVAGTYLLELVKEKYKEPRILKIMGEDAEIEVIDFTASDKMPTQVQVVTGSALPQSKVARQQLILQGFQAGLFGNPQDEAIRRRVLSLMEIGAVEALYKDVRADEKKAMKENRLFERGQVMDVDEFDDHDVHIMMHDLFRKTERYRNIQETDPELAKLIDAHVATHMQLSPKMQAQNAQAQMAQGQSQAMQSAMMGAVEKDKAQAEHLKAKSWALALEQMRKERGEE